jgi:hypothetical protein
MAKQTKVPKTFAVPCHIVDPATAAETSLAENIIRVAMHPADQFIAFHDLVVQIGLSIDDDSKKRSNGSFIPLSCSTARKPGPLPYQS